MPPAINEAVYRMVSKWTDTTRIEYVPDAKRPGTKSYERYQCYSQARTVGEALRLGAKPEDLLHDYSKKYLKMAKEQRRKPPPGAAGEAEREILQKFVRRMRGPQGCNIKKAQAKQEQALERLKELGIDLKDMRDERNCQENTELQALRLAADLAACEVLTAADDAGRKVTDKEVLDVLELWAFRKNESRQNVLPEGKTWVNSDTLGLIRDRTGKWMVTAPTKDYPHFIMLLCRWLSDRRPPELAADFPFTTISLNYAYAAKRHRDNGNIGPSMIKAFGAFKGGRLCYWPDDDKATRVEGLRDEDKVMLDINQGLALFDGNRGHEVEAFQGERFSLVFFSVNKHWKAAAEDQELLTERGFVIPTEASMAMVRSLLPPPRGYVQSQSLTSMFGIKEKPKVYQWFESPDTAGASKAKPAAAPKAGDLKAILFGGGAPERARAEAAGEPAGARSPAATGGPSQAGDSAASSHPDAEAPSQPKPAAAPKTGNLKAILFGGAPEPARADAAGEPAGAGPPAVGAPAAGSPSTGDAGLPSPGSQGGADQGAASLTPPRQARPLGSAKRPLETSGSKTKRARREAGAARTPQDPPAKLTAPQAVAQAGGAGVPCNEPKVAPPTDDLASPEFDPEQALRASAWDGSFALLTRAVKAAESTPEMPSAALSNYFRMALHAGGSPVDELRTTLHLLLPPEPLPEQVLRAAAVEAFGGPDLSGQDDVAEVALARRQKYVPPGHVQPLKVAAVEAACRAVREQLGEAGAAAEAAQPAGQHLAGLLRASRPESGETLLLVQLLLAKTALSTSAALRALAHAFVLTRPPRADAAPAELRPHGSVEARTAALAAMDRAVNLAYGEVGGSVERLLTVLLSDCRPAELYGRCGPKCGAPILPMQAMKSSDLEATLSRLAGSPLLMEQRYAGERAQLHKSGSSCRIFGSRQDDLGSSLGQDVLAAASEDVQAGECVLDGVLQRGVGEAASVVFWAFDCLWLEGRALVRQSLRERRAALAQALRTGSVVRAMPSEEFPLEDPLTMEVAAPLLGEAASCGCSGVLLKRLDKPYEAGGVSAAWLAVTPPQV